MTIDKMAEALGVRPLEEAVASEQESNDPPGVGQEPITIDHEPQDPPSTEVTVASNCESTDLAPATDIAKEAVDDMEKAQRIIEEVISEGKDAVKELSQIAKQSESPRAYEVMADLIRSVTSASRDFIDVTEKKRYAKEEISSGGSQTKSPNVINNNLVLSTSDLLATLSEAMKK